MFQQPTKKEVREKIAQLRAEAERLMGKAPFHNESRKLIQQASFLEDQAAKLEDALDRITRL